MFLCTHALMRGFATQKNPDGAKRVVHDVSDGASRYRLWTGRKGSCALVNLQNLRGHHQGLGLLQHLLDGTRHLPLLVSNNTLLTAYFAVHLSCHRHGRAWPMERCLMRGHSLAGASPASCQLKGFTLTLDDSHARLNKRDRDPATTSPQQPRKLSRVPRKIHNAHHRGRQVQALRGPGPKVRPSLPRAPQIPHMCPSLTPPSPR